MKGSVSPLAEILTFSQCLKRLMHRYQFSSTSLASMIGGRTELKRVLANDATDACRRSLFEKMKNSRLFSQEDYQQLEHSLDISRIGIEQYRFDHHMRLLMEDAPIPAVKPLVLEDGVPIMQRLESVRDAGKVEILCINSCFSSVVEAVQPLFKDESRDVALWHVLHTDVFAPLSSAFLAVSFPLLFDARYRPYGMKAPLDTHLHALGGNLLVVRAHYPAHISQLCFIVLDEQTAIEMPNASEANVFAFLSKALLFVSPSLMSLKSALAQNDDFSALCMNYLSHELNRSTYSITSDLCFYQIPTDIAKAAFLEKAFFSQADMASILERTLAIHEQRYQNHYNKRKDAYQIMTYAGCKRFLETGMCADHFVGFRAFTPEERKCIFGAMIENAKKNSFFVPLLLKDHDFRCRFNLFSSEKLGIYLDKKDTDYDLRKGHSSILITYPEFTKQYTEYYLKTLTKEMCHSPEESLQLLMEMFRDFLNQNGL